MNLSTYRPRDLFEDVFSEFVSGALQRGVSAPSTDWKPPVQIREDEKAYTLSLDVPGMSPEEIDVSYEDGILTISGERLDLSQSEEGSLKREERSFGKFLRQFSLPESVSEEEITANSKNGVLVVTLPRTKKPEPKKISVAVN